MKKRWLNQIPLAVVVLILFLALTHVFVSKDKLLTKVVARTTFPNLSPIKDKEDTTQDSTNENKHTTNTILESDNNIVLMNSGRLNYRENVMKMRNTKTEKPLKNKELIHLNHNKSNNIIEDLDEFGLKFENIPSHAIYFHSQTGRSITSINSSQNSPAFPGVISNFKGPSHLQIREKAILRLVRELNSKIQRDLSSDERPVIKTCTNVLENSCDKVTGCHRQELPSSALQRIEQLVTPAELRVNMEYSKCIQEMGHLVGGFYDTIVLTAASSAQFEESKELISNFAANFMPHFRNFTLVFYNMGLSIQQKKIISRMLCDECYLLDFPFQTFPDHVSTLKCSSWKAVIIKSIISHCNVLLWVDPTTRFLPNVLLLKELFRRVMVCGFQGGVSEQLLPYVTRKEMFHFFGDKACAYLPYANSISTFTLFHNEHLIRSAVIEPWTACALNTSCMCLKNSVYPKRSQSLDCSKRTGNHDYGKCHSFDQSALSIIIRKLFQSKSHHLFIENISDFFG